MLDTNDYLVTPRTANTINASILAIFAFQLIMMPLSFMAGGAFQRPWVTELPKNRDHRLNFLATITGFLMTTYVVGTFYAVDSLYVTLAFAISNGLATVHWIYAFFTSNPQYATHRPDGDKQALGQWVSVCFLQIGQFILALLPLVNGVDIQRLLPYNVEWATDVALHPRVLANNENINLVSAIMMLVFGSGFFFAPVHFLSGFFEDVPERKEGDSELQMVENGVVAPVSPTKAASNEEERPKFMGFTLIKMHGAEYWWARNAAILMFGWVFASFVKVDGPVEFYRTYLFTNVTLYGFGIITLFQICSLMNNNYRGITKRHITMNWIPNTLMSIAVVISLLMAVVQK